MRTWLSPLVVLSFALLASTTLAADGNRLTYLDEVCDPYYPHRAFAKLTTPQWVGEPGVDCVVVLAIDDMADPEKYEAYLRPIFDRLKKIDGRAGVSIMTNKVDPRSERVQEWLKEGVALDIHTIDHPCPCLQGSDFAKARGTYEKCVDLLNQVPGNKPVAFRMPCCDSQNTPSPRFWTEIFNRTTEKGNFLTLDSSVFNIITASDKELPESITRTEQGEERFRRYVPFQSYVNTIEDYPYPYVIGRVCWQFPCVVPSDWSAQHVQKPNNPDTVRDLKLALDACVTKQGVYNLVFHPHGWIRNDQVVELIDHAVEKYGPRVKFLNFHECQARLNKHLLADQPLRNAQGEDNGVRLLDIDNDGYLDVVIGAAEQRAGQTRRWSPKERQWITTTFPERFDPSGPRFGILNASGAASLLGRHGEVWHWQNNAWQRDERVTKSIVTKHDKGPATVDHGVRLRDFNGDGLCECLADSGEVFAWDAKAHNWIATGTKLPGDVSPIYVGQLDAAQTHTRDGGLRFVDLDGDHDSDLVVANEQQQGVWRFASLQTGWQAVKLPADARLPLIAREGTNNGAWFHSQHLWVQNEDTQRLPNFVDRRSYAQLLAQAPEAPRTITPTDRSSAPGQEASAENLAAFTPAKSPEEALQTFTIRPGLRVELVACEPLVVDPVAFDWGPDGRLWVVEMRDYPRGLDDRGQPGGRVKVLADTNGDGKYDTAKVFLDNLPFPTGIKVWRNGVLVTAAPEVLYAADTNGDDVADQRETLYRGFGEGNQQHRVNGLRFGLDGWLYLGNGDSGGSIKSLKTGQEVNIRGRDLRIDPDSGALDPLSGQTQYSLCFDDAGNRFGGNNSEPLWHYVLEDYQVRRNPHLAASEVLHRVPRVPGNASIFPTSKTITRFNDYHTANRFTSACGIEIYRDTFLGDDFTGNSFVCEPVHNLVHRERLAPTGSTFASQRPDDEAQREFFSSSDNWFRPVMARTGPDGALYIADMYRLVIEHPTWIPADWQAKLDVRAGSDRGRIYRIVPAKQAAPALARLDKLSTPELIKLLSSRNGTLRELAHQQLVWQRNPQTAELLIARLNITDNPYEAQTALWILDKLDALPLTTLTNSLNSPHALVRKQAARLCEPRLAKHPELGAALAKLQSERDPQVALQVACSLRAWSDPRAGVALAQLLLTNTEDRWLAAAVASSLTGDNLTLFWQTLATDVQAADRYRSQTLRMAQATGNNAILAQMFQQLTANQKQSDQLRFQRASTLLSALRANQAQAAFKPDDATLQAIQQVFVRARALVKDAEQPIDTRVAACELLFQPTASFGTIERDNLALAESLLTPQTPTPLQHAAIVNIGRAQQTELHRLLLREWPARTPAARGLILNQLLANKAATPLLVEALAQGTVQPGDLDANCRQLLLRSVAAESRAEVQRLLGGAIEGDRAKIVAQHANVLALRGHVEQGQQTFVKRCSACHRFGGQGRTIGPDLASLTDKSPGSLLVAILDPNRAVEAKFVDYTVVDDEGRQFSGVITAETGNSVTLIGPDGQSHTLLRDAIETLRSTGKSLMPEGFERDLAPQDLADLIAYVRSTTAPPKQFAGNKPTEITASAAGEYQLTAATARIYGTTIIFESKYQNLGYWTSQDDLAQWTLQLRTPGKYRVYLDYACLKSSAGGTFLLRAANAELTGMIQSTGTWDDYREQAIGDIELTADELAAGELDVTFRSSGELPHALLDLRGIRLEPIK